MLVSHHLEQLIGPLTQGQVTTDDSVQLLYQTLGRGPAILWANGIGVRYPGAVKQILALRDRYQLVFWDYRGMGQSVMPDPARGDVSMPRQARDALAVLDHLKIERAIFIGWSMGVQVSLEAIRAAPERVAGFIALLGTYGRVFHTAFPEPVGKAIDDLLVFLQRHPAVAQGALDLAVALPKVALALLTRMLFIGADADPEVFDADVRAVAGVEKAFYLRTLLELNRHSASDLLPHVSCPSLIICAERDYLTPPRVARHMADTIPGAIYREAKGATHFALIEQPERVNAWILELAERVYGPTASS